MKTFTRVVVVARRTHYLSAVHSQDSRVGLFPIEQIRRFALCQSFQAKQDAAMISQDESDGSEMWSSAASCFPLIQALRAILSVEILLPAFHSRLC